MPWAVKMANGKMMRTAQSGLKPEMMAVKMINIEAMEFLEAKKPLVVEMRPVMARMSDAIPIIGARKIESILPLQEKKTRTAFFILLKKTPQEKSFINISSVMVDGYLIISYPRQPMTTRTAIAVMINGIFGSERIMKRRCGWASA